MRCTASLHLPTFLDNHAVAGSGSASNNGSANGGGLAVGDLAAVMISSSAFQGNQVSVDGGSPGASDCVDLGSPLTSLGHNVVSTGTGATVDGRSFDRPVDSRGDPSEAPVDAPKADPPKADPPKAPVDLSSTASD